MFLLSRKWKTVIGTSLDPNSLCLLFLIDIKKKRGGNDFRIHTPLSGMFPRNENKTNTEFETLI